METIIKNTFMGLNYEIGNQNNVGSWYSVYDLGKVTNKKIEVASGSSCDKRYNPEYVENVIKEVLESL